MKVRKDTKFYQCENCSVWHPQMNMVNKCTSCGGDYCDVCSDNGQLHKGTLCYRCEIELIQLELDRISDNHEI